uniref:WRC domain-containing protein n=1 Tax=Oryza punctata TaxID=4537 RepID=A0A0E0JZV8_ORYPU
MRIRRAASRLLGLASAFSAQAAEAAPPPTASELLPPPPAPAASVDAIAPVNVGLAGPERPCELSLSPWDLPCELFSDSIDSQNLQEAPFDKYLVRIPPRASFVLNIELEDDTMELKDKIWTHDDEVTKNQKPAADRLKKDGAGGAAKKRTRKGIDEPILQEEEDMVMKTEERNIWFCKKNDGKKWHCPSIVDGPNTMCDYHLARSRSCYTPSSEKVDGASVTAAATSSGPTKASKNTAPAKSSGAKQRTSAGGAASSSKAAPAIAPLSSSKSSSSVSVTVPTSSISQRRKRTKKSTNGSGGDYYFYDLFGPFRGKDRRNHGVVSAGGVDHRRLLQQEKAVVPLEAKEKKEYIDVADNLSNNSSITGGGDKENDEDYVVGGAGKARADKGKGKIALEKMKMVKKRVKERSLKSLL